VHILARKTLKVNEKNLETQAGAQKMRDALEKNARETGELLFTESPMRF